ncbi:MAG: UDP-N-acetylglucosamine diphosphorylase/glucosamine-1-phosphate N-acetyltransferase [Gammaproteobacteria bacterium]|nr:UDP-N-acetylglucosamine diphosphorylase/glucosamine-1-phosphate N-acetyltransferase [Gammaproteobacteria bacterium]MYF67960.1 UDP-N-acetylglucosamine diphosphorylase/glucosamine-1-phosphate N-acetyltransferase [Gammaproteobacteria bacterium]MYK37757.1 UDP-N-acetylglucosamine diphosphorylase/glucosamine-1-phosphate N-acetyltransferase [Gammaproteobacteria bacterium]
MAGALNVVILAAGQGTRMRSAMPKPLHRLGGKPLLAHVIDGAAVLEPDRVVVVCGHGAEPVRAVFSGAPIDWVEQDEQLGSGHAVIQALPAIDPGARVLVLYSDVALVTGETLRRLVADDDGVSLLTAEVEDPSGYGRIIRNPDGAVAGIVEHADATPEQRLVREINVGPMAAPGDWLGKACRALKPAGAKQEIYLTHTVDIALAEGTPVRAVRTGGPDEAMGVNSPAQLAEAGRLLQRRRTGELMEAGVRIADPKRIEIRADVQAGRDVFLDVGVVLQGDIVLGDGASIGAYSVVSDTRIDEGARIEPHCVVDGAHIGARARVGPFARLRPQARLGEEARVGNFVEVKNSELGDGAKASHLSYVGDSEVGRDVNIGAGVITCNYDGKRKHRTVIGEGAFIGSGVELVAPVEVGAGAMIGAGSTITKPAPAERLTVARSRQKTLPLKKR